MKRVLIVTGIFPPAIGGPATHAQTMIPALYEAGHRVDLVTYGDAQTLRSPLARTTVVAKGWWLPLRYTGLFFATVFRGFGVQTIFALDTMSVGVPAMLAQFFLRKRFVVRVVGDYAWEQARGRFGVQDSLDVFQTKHQEWRIECWRFLQKWVVRRADVIITPSQYLAGIIRGWGVDPANIQVVPNAVDVPVAFTPIKPSTTEKRLLSIARFTPWKGMAELVEAFVDVVQQIPEARLTLMGDGPERERIQQKIEQLGLKESVMIQPPVPHEALPEWYARAYGFVLNTSYEGLSHQLLEVMAAGLPFATTLAGGNAEVVRDGKNGRAFPVNDRAAMTQAMIELLLDRQTVLTRAEEALIQARGWTEEQMTQAIQRVLFPLPPVGSRILIVSLDEFFLDEHSVSAERLREYAAGCERVDVLVLGAGTRRETFLSSTISVLKSGGWTKIDALLRGWFLARRLAQQKRYTTVDCQDPFFTAWIGSMVAVKTGARFLIEVHGDFWGSAPRYAVSFWRKWLAASFLSKADGIRTVSQRVLRHLHRAVPDVRLSTILKLPVPVTVPSIDLTASLRTSDQVHALFVGRLSPEKGLEEFLNVFARVTREVPRLFLKIVGKGAERGKLEACVRALGLSNHVSFVGWLRDPSTSFQQADFLVLPSYHESWGMVVIEALGAGLPVLMTDVGCAGEVVQHEKNGLIVPVGDAEAMTMALKRMATDTDLRRRLAAQTRSSIATLPTREQAVRLYRQFWLGSQDT